MPRSPAYQKGYEEAQRQFLSCPKDDESLPLFWNPFVLGSDEWQGFEAAVYDFIQK